MKPGEKVFVSGCPSDAWMSNFEYNEEGKLIIDSAWHDVRYPTKLIIVINGKIYWVRNVFYRTGSDVAAALQLAERYTFNPNAKCMVKYDLAGYLFLPCVEKCLAEQKN